MRILPALLLTVATFSAGAQTLPIISDATLDALAGEISGESAKRSLEGISRFHRMRGSREFRLASELVLAELKKSGLRDAEILELPADGKIFYGTQRSRPAWNADFAELWEVGADGARTVRLASFHAAPISLAQDSASADVTAELIDAGEGTKESDYEGREIKGKIVLVGSQPEAVQRLAIERYGAAGILSYAPNQRTGWWKQDETLVRWGHLDTFNERKTYGFMISLGEARSLQQRLSKGEKIRLHALVKAGQSAGSYDIATATIPGTNSPVASEEIIFSCHLDHPRPGANDNASGCATILEVARTLRKLIDEKRIAPPRRTIRFVWPPEIEGTYALLHGKPEIAARIRAAIHLDMVGGGAETKSIFHVTRGPASLPSFVYDVAASIGHLVDRQSALYAMTGSAKWPLVAPEGSGDALRAAMVPFTMGSDHQVYTSNSWSIPAIYLNDWPDRYIHTNGDTAAKIDPTKLKRAAFIAAASGLVLANASSSDAAALQSVVEEGALRRMIEAGAARSGLPPAESENHVRFQLWYEREVARSLSSFFVVPETEAARSRDFLDSLPKILPKPGTAPQPSGIVYRRSAVRGSLDAFGYDYLEDQLGIERAARVQLLSFRGSRGSGGEYAYEALNLVDGKRTASQIRDALSAIYGAVPQSIVDEFLAVAKEGKLLH